MFVGRRTAVRQVRQPLLGLKAENPRQRQADGEVAVLRRDVRGDSIGERHKLWLGYCVVQRVLGHDDRERPLGEARLSHLSQRR